MADPFHIFIPKPENGNFKLSDLSEADSAILTEVFNSYAGHNVTCGIGKSRPTTEEKEARIQAKTNKKAAAARAKEEKAAAKAQKTADKSTKKAEKESEKEAVKKIAANTEAAAQKAIDSKPSKKSHHNPAKGY